VCLCVRLFLSDHILECDNLGDTNIKMEAPETVTAVDPSMLELPVELAEAEEEEEKPSMKRRRGPRPKSYCCDVCGVSFDSARVLRVHLRGHDQSLLPSFECGECKRSFLWPSHLERHMRTHTGVRPYTCYACDRQFAQVISTVCNAYCE